MRRYGCSAVLGSVGCRRNDGASSRLMIGYTVLVASELIEGRLARPAKNQLPVKMRLLGEAHPEK